MEKLVRVEGIAAPLYAPTSTPTSSSVARDHLAGGRATRTSSSSPWRSSGRTGARTPTSCSTARRFRAAPILIAGENFGCGSSREMAVWALRQFGIRAIVAPSFGEIFRANCLRNGILPAALPAATVAGLAERAQSGSLVLAVDLERREVREAGGPAHPFAVGEREREMMLEGLDDIALTLRRKGDIESFQARDREARPWIWAGAPD